MCIIYIYHLHKVISHLPSGKLTVGYGKSPSLVGKSTISMSYVTNYQRVKITKHQHECKLQTCDLIAGREILV